MQGVIDLSGLGVARGLGWLSVLSLLAAAAWLDPEDHGNYACISNAANTEC